VTVGGVVISDLLAISGAFAFAAAITYGFSGSRDAFADAGEWLLVTLIVLFGLQTALGSYRSFSRISPLRQNRLSLRSYLYGVVMTTGILFVVRKEIPQVITLFFLGIPVLWLILRTALWSLLRTGPPGFGVSRTLVIGSAPLVDRVSEILKQFPAYEMVSTVVSGHIHPETLDLERRIQDEKLDLVFLPSTAVNGSREYLEQVSRSHKVHVRILPPDIDVLLGRSPVDDLIGIPVLLASHHFTPGRKTFKRFFDCAGALVLSIVLSPLLLAVAIATKLESPGPVLFRQRRSLSGSGESFNIYKFRSMQEEAEKGRTSLKNDSSGPLFKVRNDPRVTRVGRFIRRYSIDELPQLINVFRGEMSLVGPRPLPVEDFEQLSTDDAIHSLHRHRSFMKPGLTGLWQISGRSDLGFREMVLLDVYYIENHTHLFDLEILLRTIPAVLFAKGAY
jgi:exopolysaccharide biosynthesis polyprenyl glycosylphosphotransferase